MKSLYILVMMQLKEQMNFRRHSDEKMKIFQSIFGVVGAIAKFAAVAVLCFAFMYVGDFLAVFGGGIPDVAISCIFSVLLLMSIISCTVGLTKSLYYARDNSVLLTLPCTPIQVYLSKLVIFFIYEMRRNFSFLVPLFFSYFLFRNVNLASFEFKTNLTYDNMALTILWMLLCIVVVSLCTVAIGAILSIPTMWAANFYRQHKSIQIVSIVFMIVGVGAAFALILYLIISAGRIDIAEKWPEIFRFIQDVIFVNYKKYFDFLYELGKLILGELSNDIAYFYVDKTLIRFGIVFAITAVTFGLGFLLVRPLFYKMASTPFEYLKKSVKPKKNRAKGKLFSSIYTNYLIVLKNSSEIFYNLGILLSVPMLVYLLNAMFMAMDVSKNGVYMIIAVNILIILIVLLNSNCALASLFSRDGQSRYLIKTIPANYALPILTKMIPNMSFAILSIVATFFVLKETIALDLSDVVLLTFSILFIYVAHALYSAELDLMNPKHQLYQSVGNSVSNPNEIKSTTTAFIIPFLIAAAILFLLFEEKGYVFVKLIAVSAAVLAYRIWMFFSTLRLYYKEK